jgi:GNAT superfamily N-acetyltransferase
MSDESTPDTVRDVSSLRFRPMERTDEDLLLFQQAFTENNSPRSLELLRWQYFEPPAGPLYVDFAVANEDKQYLAAIYAVFPVVMRIKGTRQIGVQSLNTLTDVRYRGKGLFIRLAKSVYERCAREGVAVVYGFPNGNSAHGFFQKLEWQSYDPMPILIRPLRLGYIVSRLSRGKINLPKALDLPLPRPRAALPDGWTLRTITDFGPEFDELWRRFSEGIGFAVERNSEYLRWRLRRPGASYETRALFDGSVLIGYAITGNQHGEGGRVMELIYDPQHPRAGTILLSDAMRRLSAAGCGVVWAWNYEHSSNHKDFVAARFIQLPKRFNIEDLHSGGRSFSTPPQPEAAERKQWYVSGLDSDTT